MGAVSHGGMFRFAARRQSACVSTLVAYGQLAVLRGPVQPPRKRLKHRTLFRFRSLPALLSLLLFVFLPLSSVCLLLLSLLLSLLSLLSLLWLFRLLLSSSSFSSGRTWHACVRA